MRQARLASAVLGIVIGIGVCARPVGAGDWPQWRGPQRDGISSETGLLHAWPQGGPKIAWKTDKVGEGYSTPAVAADRVYLIGNEGKQKEFVEALSAQDGRQLWLTVIGQVGKNRGPQYPGSRGTTTVDGDLLYAIGSNGDLDCLETATGKIVWHKDLRSEFGGIPGSWAYSESPLVDGNVVVCTPGGSQATIVALNKQNGDVIWKSAVPGGEQAAYSSVMSVDVAGTKEYVQFLQRGVVGIDANTGKYLWRYDKTAQGSPANIPTPVIHNGELYSATGRGGGALIKLNPGSESPTQVYFNKALPASIGGSVVVGGNLYGTNSQGLMCVDFQKGDIKWKDRSIGPSSVLFADGDLYLHGENGKVALVQATADGYHKHGEFLPPGGTERTGGGIKAWQYPVIANGHLYIRDQGFLWCFDIHQ